jgi:hypothetical protein
MRLSAIGTVNSGTPVNIAVTLGLMTSAQIGKIPPIYASRIFIEMLQGGTKTGYVLCLDANPLATPLKTTSGQLVAQLQAADATDPGGFYADSMITREGAINICNIYVDGDNTGDTFVVSIDKIN